MMPAINALLLAVSNSLAASIAAKATVVTVLCLIATRVAPRSRASARHALLAAAFGVLLVLPVASLVAPPVRIAVPVVVQERAVLPALADAIDAIPTIAKAYAGAGVTPVRPRSSGLSLPVLSIAAWIVGATLSLLPMLMGLRQVRWLRRTGLAWSQGQSLADGLARDAGIRRRVAVLLHDNLPGPMTCGVAQPAIVLPSDAKTWDQEDLIRALVHELEHVRRGDWMSQCVARTVCAVYWFHPLVWMAWRHLALEAERSCDDAVLGCSEATVYADQLVGLALRLLAGTERAQKSPLLAMANHADLTTRVRALLDSRQRRGRAGAFSVALSSVAAVLLVLTISPLGMVAAPQSSSPQTGAVSSASPGASHAAAAMPEFEAVSVKLVDPDMRETQSHETSDAGRLSMIDTMHRFIRRAYGITDEQIGGEPDWFKTHLYSIEAVTSTPAREDRMMLMLRGVLADRFQLRLRQEYRDLPVYVLEVAPGGPKFKELKPGEVPGSEAAPPEVFAKNFTSLEGLLKSLNSVFGGRLHLDRPVVDRTHLTGRYNIQLRTEIESQTDDSGRRTLQFSNLFHDMQSELGLKLTPARVSMPYLVVERAAFPTAN